MKKVLFVGVFHPNSTNVAQVRAFSNNKCDAYAYDYRAKLNKFNSIQERDNNLKQIIQDLKPDITLFSKCNAMHYSVVDEANKAGKTALWYMDALNNFDSELIEKVKRCNTFICGLEGVVTEGLKYNNDTIFIDQCPDEQMNFYIPDCEKKYDSVFIGNINASVHSDRETYKQLCNFTHLSGVYGLEHNQVVNETKINLGFAPTDGCGTSVRAHKILAAKGFYMSTPWPGMEKTFTPGVHLETFTSPEELNEKIEYYLAHPEERQKISEQGNAEVQQYMPLNWAKRILEHME